MSVALGSMGALILVAHPVVAQTGSVAVNGRVVTEAGAPVAGAHVEVSRGASVSNEARTDSTGAFRVQVSEAEGEEIALRVLAPGFVPSLARFRAERSEVDLGAVKLVNRPPVLLKTLRVNGRAPVPQIARMPELEKTGMETWAGRERGSVTGDHAGDLTALTASVPGVVGGPQGVSAFGLDPSQNGVTLNGLSIGGLDVPRNLRTSIRVTRSTYDPARGGFAGLQTAVNISPAYGFETRRGNFTMDRPSDSSGGFFRLEQGLEGRLSEKVTYTASVSAARRSTARQPFWDAGNWLSGGAWPEDSLSALRVALRDKGIRPSTAIAGGSSNSTRYSLVARADYLAFNAGTWSLLGYGQMDRATYQGGPMWLEMRDAPGSSRSLAGLQVSTTRTLAKRFLSEMQTGVNASLGRSGSADGGAAGLVGIVAGADGLPGGATSRLGFGAERYGAFSDATFTWDVVSETRWIPWTSHQLKLHLLSRVDHSRRESELKPVGSFAYASVGDFQAGRATEYERVEFARSNRSTLWNGAAALGDTWNPSSRFQVLGGLRGEIVRPITTNAVPDSVSADFGGRQGYRGTALHISPRLGFSFAYGGKPGGSAGAARTGGGILRGGVGEFRASVPASMLASMTGPTDHSSHLRCLGDATPAIDWTRAFLTEDVPTSCVGGAGSLSVRSRSARLLDRDFEPGRSWRTNIAWTTLLGAFTTTIDASYALNLNQPGWVDLNFTGQPQFVLDREGGRPVYTSREQIDAGTGHPAAAEGRLLPAFSSVLAYQSNLRSTQAQGTIRAVRQLPANQAHFAASYTLGRSRAQHRGFGGGAFGNPAQAEWAPSDFDVRHQAILSAGRKLPRLGYLSLFGIVGSPRPFTPVVEGDPNGDGRSGDRAFIPGTRSGDNVLADAVSRSLTGTRASARQCVLSQAGGAAGRNSCRGYWTRTVNLDLAATRPLGHGGRQLRINLTAANLVDGLDRAFHGFGSPKGWDGSRPIDPVLLRVTGFDRSSSSFQYSVNPGFGRARMHGSQAPFRVVLDFGFEWGKSIEQQTIERALRPERREGAPIRPTAAVIRERLGYIGRDFFPMVLGMADELMLDGAQEDLLRRRHAEYSAEIDTIRSELAAYLAALPSSYSVGEVVSRQASADSASLEVVRRHARALSGILTPLQATLLPPMVRTLMAPTPERRGGN